MTRHPPHEAPRTITENLILADAFDGFGVDRRELLWQFGLFIGAGGGSGSRVVARGERGGRQLMLPLTEDEFGLMNVVVSPQLYERQRTVVRTEPFMIVDGVLQRRDPTISVRARTVTPLRPPPDLIAPPPHDFCWPG